MGRLDGKRALISGTGGGIGRATALLCAREGAHVVGCDLHAATSDETVGLVRASGGRMADGVRRRSGGQPHRTPAPAAGCVVQDMAGPLPGRQQ